MRTVSVQVERWVRESVAWKFIYAGFALGCAFGFLVGFALADVCGR